MSRRIHNFSAGPAILPVEVLERAQNAMLDFEGTGVGIMEHSHRGAAFRGVFAQAEADCRKLAGIPDNYKVLFVQGGASSQFYTIPMNFLKADQTADYLVTGAWAKKAVAQAKRFGNVHIAATSDDKTFSYIPEKCQFSDDPAYVHYTSNNTIFGTQFASEPDVPSGVPLICDASSDIFCRPIDISKYGIVYAGAQKNLGPSGVTLVIIREDLVKAGSLELPEMLQYRTHAENDSMYNTPPTFGIFVMGLVFEWLLEQGGLDAIEKRNHEKAALLYDCLDASDRFRATAAVGSRSLMNVTFVSDDADVDAKFLEESKAAGFDALKGHRSVGGMRASIYNAFPTDSVEELVQFIKDFEAKNG